MNLLEKESEIGGECVGTKAEEVNSQVSFRRHLYGEGKFIGIPEWRLDFTGFQAGEEECRPEVGGSQTQM